jgi:hypothetical protein
MSGPRLCWHWARSSPLKAEEALRKLRMVRGQTLLAFLEDPGAANFLGPILARKFDAGDDVRLYAEGTGAARLKEMGVRFHDAAEMGTAAEAIQREAPWAVLIGTSENLDTAAFDLIKAARVAGLPSIAGVDNAANADFRFRGHGDDPLAHAPDFLLLSDDLARRNYAALGFTPDRIVVCGHPYFDAVREAGFLLAKEGRGVLRSRLFPDAGSRPVVVFLGEISSGLNPGQFTKSTDYTLHGRGQSVVRTEIVIEEFLDAAATMKRRPYLVLRPHPKNTDAELGSYYSEFDKISRSGGSLGSVFAADLVVGMSTSLLVEASLLGRPTLSIVPRLREREWLPTTAAGITPCVHRREEIASAMAVGLSGSEADDIEVSIPTGATERALETLERIRCQGNAM